MDEITLRDYIKVLFRQKIVVIVAFVTVMVTVTVGLILQTPAYEATVKMLISGEKAVSSPYYTELVGYQNIQAALTQTEIVRSQPVLDMVVRTIGIKPLDYEAKFANPVKALLVRAGAWWTNRKMNSLKLTEEQKKAYLYRFFVEDLKQNIKVEPVRDTNMFTISYRDYSPVAAAAIANIVSRSYAIYDLEQQLAEMQLKYGEKHLAVTQLRDNIDKLTKNLTGQPLPDVEAIGPASVKIIEQAQPPLRPTGIPKLIIFILALFMAIFLSIMLAFAFDYLDQTFKTPAEVTKSLGISYLGSVPRRITQTSFKDTAEQVYFEIKDKKIKSIVFTAALPREGVTTLVHGIGAEIAKKANFKVLLIDANPVNPSLHRISGTQNREGLFDVLEGRVSLDRAVTEKGAHLAILTAGKTSLNPAALFDSHKMADLIKLAGAKYDAVLIDAANLMESKDVLTLVNFTDSVILLVSEGKTRRQVAKSAIVPLEQKKANLLGAILGNRTYAIPRAIYERV